MATHFWKTFEHECPTVNGCDFALGQAGWFAQAVGECNSPPWPTGKSLPFTLAV